jgi:hypothetical protein
MQRALDHLGLAQALAQPAALFRSPAQVRRDHHAAQQKLAA